MKLRPVLWGLGLQFLLGVIILRTSWGYATFRFIGAQVLTFLNYTNVGAQFVFGNSFEDHFFAFKVHIAFFSIFKYIFLHIWLSIAFRNNDRNDTQLSYICWDKDSGISKGSYYWKNTIINVLA